MSETRFRLLIVLSVVCSFAAGALGYFVPPAVSAELAQAYAREPNAWLEGHLWLVGAVSVVYAVAAIAGLVGLFRFKRWGRALSLYLTPAGFVLYLFVGPTLTSPLENMLAETGWLLWGAALALAYYSPLSPRFGAVAQR